MTNKGISIFYGDAALLLNWQGERFLCVSDLHLGYTPSANVPLYNGKLTVTLANKILKVSKRARVENLFLLGDVKHTIARVLYSDRSSINQFFDVLKPYFKKIYLVLGNHDGSIMDVIPSYVNAIRTGFLLGNTYLMHGHTLPGPDIQKADLIIMGHLHPLFYREHSPLNGQRVWIIMTLYLRALFPKINKPYKLVIMPSFNPEISFPLSFSYSSNFSSRISPLLNRCKMDVLRIKVISFDGTILSQN